MTALKLSLRLPPTCDAKIALRARSRHLMEDDPPYGAKVNFEANWGATGWDAPDAGAVAGEVARRGVARVFRQAGAYMGEGGTIPFMAMLGERFPAGAIPDHRSAGPRCECARPQRVPAYPDRQAAERRGRAGARGSFHSRGVNGSSVGEQRGQVGFYPSRYLIVGVR